MSIRRFNPFTSNASTSGSIQSTRPPTYTSNVTAAPTYTPNEAQQTTGAHARNERVSGWSASLPTASSVADSDTVFDQAESSLEDTVSVGESSAEIASPAGPRYVYYRVFAEDGAIPSANPVYSDDPYLGRILAKLVAPPHTAMTLKYCLSNFENIDNTTPTKLFIAPSSQTPMDDAGSVSILVHPGPGCTPNEPIALVIASADVDRGPLDEDQPEGVLLLPQGGPSPFKTRYLYYRLYRNYAAVRSKQPADSNNPSVGRISVDSVAPPHTAASIIRCISKIEGLDNSKQLQLFTSISSTSPIGEGHVSILTSNSPGSTPEDPMAFVELQTPAAIPTPYPTFTKRMRVIHQWPYPSGNPDWLMTPVGEIIRITNDEPQNQSYVSNGKSFQCPAYEAVDDAGKKGFVCGSFVQPC